MLACSPALIKPGSGIEVIGEHFGGLISTGNYEEFCLILHEEDILALHLDDWGNPFESCNDDNMAEVFDEDLDGLVPGGIPYLADDYSSSDGLDDFLEMLADDYELNTDIVPAYSGAELPDTPFFLSGVADDDYYVFSYEGPNAAHDYGAYCLASETDSNGKTVIAGIRLGCCYDGFTACSEEACNACPGVPQCDPGENPATDFCIVF
jgi:hypothetical protein